MKFSLNWLNDFVEVSDFKNQPEKLIKILTEAGLEVEEQVSLADSFQKIVVAQIKTINKHPNATRLSLCEVEEAEGRVLKIVCGASNMKERDKVVLALPGAVLPVNIVIKTSKIRGERSEGMLVSARELGLAEKKKEKLMNGKLTDKTDEKEGIIILRPEAIVGSPYSEEAGLDDVIFDINVTPNRSDCLSHFGLAREISCLLNRPLKESSSVHSEISFSKKVFMKKELGLKVEDKKTCLRYCGRMIKGVSIAPSPSWLRERLERVGLKSINNVVDVTNYILMEWGQPLHAFDRDKLHFILVDSSIKGEKFTTLEDSVLTLTGEELTIRDCTKKKNNSSPEALKAGSRAIALAGVMGGKDTGVSPETKNVFLEAACFSPESVRRAGRHFGLQTESSYRFSRGIDENTVLEVLDRAALLIKKIAGGEISCDFFDERSRSSFGVEETLKKQDKKGNVSDDNRKDLSDECHQMVDKSSHFFSSIQIQLKDLEERLAYKIDASSFINWMKRLSCKVIEEKNDCFLIQPPSFRNDLKIKEDLIEEIGRLEGYDQVPLFVPRKIAGAPKDFDTMYVLVRKIGKILGGRGWYQLLNYSFGEKEFYEDFLKDRKSLYNLGIESASENHSLVSLENPISLQMAVMKPLLIPDIFKNLVYNFRRNNKWGQVFETAPVFSKEGENYKQREYLGFACWGREENLWSNKDCPNLFHLKSVLEHLFCKLNRGKCNWDLKPPDLSFIHPGQLLGVKFQGKPLGFIGTLHPNLKLKYKIPEDVDVAVGELCLSPLAGVKDYPVKAKSPGDFPAVERDLTFLLPENLPAVSVAEEIKRIAGASSVKIIAIYKQKENRSVSFRLRLIPKKSAWTDKALLGLQNRVIEKIGEKFSISLK